MMTPVPMYYSFVKDFKSKGRVNTEFIITQESKRYEPTLSEIEEAYQRCLTKGSRPRILLLCNPCNPTGVVYSEQTLNMCIEWAKSKQIHIVSDEIYGNSLFPGEKLTSIAECMYQ